MSLESLKLVDENETDNFESLSKEFAQLVKMSNRNQVNLKIKLLQTKKIDDYLKNYTHPIKKVEKINSHFNFKKEAPVKMRLKKHNQDCQNKKFEFNTVNKHFKVFQNEEKNFYKEDYMKKIFNLLNKKEKNYFQKRKLLSDNGLQVKSTQIPPRIQPGYKISKPTETLTSFKFNNKFTENIYTSEKNPLKLKEIYDSEFSFSEGSLNDSYKKELLSNLNTEYNFIDPSLKTNLLPSTTTAISNKNNILNKNNSQSKIKLVKPSNKVESLLTNPNIENNKQNNKFFLTQFPKNKNKPKTINNINTQRTSTNNVLSPRMQLKELDDERNAKIKSLLDKFKL
jgi:hypothetical protein